MENGSLTLQTSPQQVNRINDGGTKRTTEAANQRGEERARHSILLVAAAQARIPRRHLALEVLEGAQVDGRVREHADQAHRQAAVEGARARLRPHLARRLQDQLVAVCAAGHRLALHSKFERVERIDEELRGHAGDAAGNEARE